MFKEIVTNSNCIAPERVMALHRDSVIPAARHVAAAQCPPRYLSQVRSPVWRQRIAATVLLVVHCALAGCGGGDDQTTTVTTGTTVTTRPIVGASGPGERPHCPPRTVPVPDGLDFSGRTLDKNSDLPYPLTAANFDGATLIGLHLDQMDLSDTTFRGAHLVGVRFGGNGTGFDNGAILNRANFEGAVFEPSDDGSLTTLNDTSLYNACFIGTTFTPDPARQSVMFARLPIEDTPGITNVDFSYSDVFSLPSQVIYSFLVQNKSKFRGLKIPCNLLIEIFIKGIDLEGTDISECSPSSLKNLDLSGQSFDGMNLKGFQFDGSTLTGASFRNMTFGGSSYLDPVDPFGTAGNMDGVIFTGATFRFTSFNGQSLKGADFSRVTFQATNFLNTRLDNAHFEQAMGDLDFGGSALWGTHFNEVLFKANFPYSTFSSETDFSDATLLSDGSAIFSGANLSGVRFNGADLRGLNFSGTKLVRASFENATLDGATGFNGTTLEQPAQLSGVRFNKVSAVGVDFSNALLYGADFTYADLTRTSFVGSFLTAGGPTSEPVAAKFDGAMLQNANFANAKLQSVSFASANLYTKNISGVPLPTCTADIARCPTSSPRTGHTCSCATLAGADLTSTVFTGTFLWGADFSSSGTIVNGSKFDGAVLIGANFGGVDFRIAGGAAPSFRGAMLQGTNLGASVAGSTAMTLTGAYVDFADYGGSGGNGVNVWLGSDHTQFRNWTGPAKVCVDAAYSTPSTMPMSATLDCPDGYNGVCGPVLPGTDSISHWRTRTPISSASPTPGWYDADATYDNATADTGSICGGNPQTNGW